LGHCSKLQWTLSEDDWGKLFRIAQQQSLVGICFSGIESLPNEQRPPKKVLLNWYASTLQIENRNIAVSKYTMELCSQLFGDGFSACILKGQAAAAYYPNALRRQSGDIDLWMRTSCGTLQKDRNMTIAFVRNNMGNAKARYHHIDYDVNNDIHVELHFMPTWLNNPITNRKLQRWFENVKDAQFANNTNGGFSVPTDMFNAIYLLLHIQKHILEEGIGLRQLLDYYYLLLKCDFDNRKKELNSLFKRFGMIRTARAVMYVLHEVFDLDHKRLLCEPDEKLGRFLIEEIMLAGNFGKYDPRIRNLQDESTLHIFLRKQKRGLRFLRINSQEVLWSPFFAVYQRVWRYRRNLI